MDLATVVDAALELPVAPSFTRLGYAARRRLFDWDEPTPDDLSDRTVVITGATSGLGRAAATTLAARGATVVIVGRDRDRTERAAAEIGGATNGEVDVAIADLAELEQVRAAARAVAARHRRIDVVVHNAGTLSEARTESSDGIETTVAAQVVGPFLLTASLLDRLRERRPGRVVTVSSGGMYAAPVTVDGLQLGPEDYRGARQYALAKRAQVTLGEMWAERVDPRDVVFHTMHPGWADTPGVRSSLPTFRRIVGPLLRDARQGADTILWLAVAAGEPATTSGGFWLDRRRRPTHRLASTRRSDTPQRRAELWRWVVETSGATVP